MTIRDEDYRNMSDDQELRSLLDNSNNLQKIFINCSFAGIGTNNFLNCRFENCSFDGVGESQFINCTFSECKFHYSFHGRMSNCVIQKHNGYLIEGSML